MLDIVQDMEHYCPEGDLAQLHQPHGHALPRHAAQTHIPVTGLCHRVQGTAMMLAHWIGAADRRWITTLRRHQPPGLVSRVQSGTARTPIRSSARPSRKSRKSTTRRCPQRDVPGPGLLRHRVQRPQLGIQLVVPQAPRPDREVLHPRHRLEPRRIRLHPEGIPDDRGHLERRRPSRAGPARSPRRTWRAARNTPPTSSTPSRAASPSSSTATCPTPASSPTCPRAPASRCRSTWTRPASTPPTSARCRPSAP